MRTESPAAARCTAPRTAFATAGVARKQRASQTGRPISSMRCPAAAGGVGATGTDHYPVGSHQSRKLLAPPS